MESTVTFSLIILLSSLPLISSQDLVPDHHFINCGSNSETLFTGKNFIGDFNPTTFLLSGVTAAAQNNHPPSTTPPIYQTARLFTKTSWYELQADETNTFVMVRLHFSPFFTNQFQVSNFKFDVSVSGFNLLSDFTVENQTVIKEFIIPVGSDPRFKIEFTPSTASSSAFINAIEAFTTPPDLFRPGTDPLPRISPAGKNGNVENITSSFAFNPIHRINIGGDMIDVINDTLRRNWVPDGSFIFMNEPAKTSTPYRGDIIPRPGGATATDAPDHVYGTAKQLNNNLVNITWNFQVNRNTTFLLRAHFCDIISSSLPDPNSAFNFFVYNHHKVPISPSKTLQWLAAPFYVDMVVDAGDSPFVNISIGADRGGDLTAFLNGVEILELVENSGFRDQMNKKKNHTTLLIVIGCVIGGVAIVLILLVGFLMGSKFGKVKPVVGAKSESNQVDGSIYTSIDIDFTINHPSPIPNLNLNLRIPFLDILHATNGFDENLVIGKGGFGTVYKGTLPSGQIVAVKRGGAGHGQGRPEFVTEITVFAKIRHRHLVSLIGYCDENSEMILVYEFMEKGTLQDHLYNTNENHPKLSWSKRLEICIGAAQGLQYLHTGLEGGIIHRDVKSTNILLNKEFVAKVADFGISRFDNEDESEVSGIKGSFGYLDPEYFKCGKLTQKSDVYSFGIVLLEVLCARAALDHKFPEKEKNLAEWAIKEINDGNVENIIDPFLLGTINLNSLRKFLSTVGRCLMDTGDERPNMVDVLWDLEYVLKLQQVGMDKEPYEDSTINTSMQLPMSMIHRLPSRLNDDSYVNDSSALSFPSESQVFSQLNIDGAR